jgi:hypothetical protein
MPNRPKSYDDTRESGLAGVLACFDGLHGDCLRLPSGHSLQLPKRIKRSERDEFEAHQVRLAERQLLEHVVRGSRVGCLLPCDQDPCGCAWITSVVQEFHSAAHDAL